MYTSLKNFLKIFKTIFLMNLVYQIHQLNGFKIPEEALEEMGGGLL